MTSFLHQLLRVSPFPLELHLVTGWYVHGSGAVVKLWCKNTKYPAWATATTDKNGYFFLEAPKTVSNFATHKCKVFLVSSPIPSCSEPSNLNGGSSGAPLKFEKLVLGKPVFTLYSVGPFAFEPKCRAPGPK